MSDHRTGTREEWLAARVELLEREKELTRRSDEVARQRRQLPWVRVDEDYRFQTEDGQKTLAELFDGRSQLLVFHLMYGPDDELPCVGCSYHGDSFDRAVAHLPERDVSFVAVSRGPLDKLLAYKQRIGWTFPWVSAEGTDFNLDFSVFTEEGRRDGTGFNRHGQERRHRPSQLRAARAQRVRAGGRRRLPHVLGL
jgi:predicted dithiol-disulfide oxidoreductase (DUF899 family)